MEVYAVVWGTGSCDDHGNAHAFSGVHGIYKSEASAKTMLEVCKNDILGDINNDLNPDGDFPEYEEEANIQVYGSVESGYFEIDYTIGTEPVEIYIQIVHNYVQD
jgi:hypothetical protein